MLVSARPTLLPDLNTCTHAACVSTLSHRCTLLPDPTNSVTSLTSSSQHTQVLSALSAQPRILSKFKPFLVVDPVHRNTIQDPIILLLIAAAAAGACIV